MTPEEGELCARVLASIAWADGTLTEEEMATVVDLVDKFEYVEKPKIQEILFVGSNFAFLERVAQLDRKLRLRLLHDAYVVANFDHTGTEAELSIVRAIAGTVVAPQKWPDVEKCLRTYADYEKQSIKLWGATHLS